MPRCYAGYPNNYPRRHIELDKRGEPRAMDTRSTQDDDICLYTV